MKTENEITNQKFLDIIEFLPDATFIIDTNHKIMAWNKEVEIMTGIKKGQMIGKGNEVYSLAFYNVQRPLLADLVLQDKAVDPQLYNTFRKEGQSFYMETFMPKFNKGNGGYAWAKAAPLFNSEGKVIGAIESTRDITERKKFEENLKQSEAKYHSLFELSPDAVGVITNNKISFANMAMVKLLGAKTNQQLIDKNILDFIEVSMRSYVSNKIDEMFKNKSTMPLIEEHLVKINGEKVVVELTATTLSDDGERSAQIIIRDISQRKKVEENLQKLYFESSIERQKMEVVMNSMGDAVFALDNDRKIILVNPIAVTMAGEVKKNIIGKKYNKIFKFVLEKENTEVTAFIENVYKHGITTSISDLTVLINKKGVIIPVADSAAPIKDNKGGVVGCVVIFRDVTKERQIDKSKSEFVSVASHQLRTPLSAIKWFLELLTSETSGELSDEQKQYLNQIIASNDRMIRLVNELLNASRMETGNLNLMQKPTNMNLLVKDVYDEVILKILEKKQKSTLETGGKLMVFTDPNLLKQVIDNLVTNANRYTQPGGTIAIRTYQTDDQAIFEIKDNGYGIPENQKNKLFTKFFRADNILTKQTDGTGLGLYVAKTAIEKLGGRIWFESQENKGTTFYFSLPINMQLSKS